MGSDAAPLNTWQHRATAWDRASLMRFLDKLDEGMTVDEALNAVNFAWELDLALRRHPSGLCVCPPGVTIDSCPMHGIPQ